MSDNENPIPYSFDDLALVDELVAEIFNDVIGMTHFMANIGRNSEVDSSEEESPNILSRISVVDHMLIKLNKKVERGLALLHPPACPSLELLHFTSQILKLTGDHGLSRKLEITSLPPQFNATWQTMRTVFRVYPLTDGHVTEYLHILQSQDPSELPIFPRHLNTTNTYFCFGDFGGYFFGENFVCNAPIPSTMQQENGHLENEESDSDGVWYETANSEEE